MMLEAGRRHHHRQDHDDGVAANDRTATLNPAPSRHNARRIVIGLGGGVAPA